MRASILLFETAPSVCAALREALVRQGFTVSHACDKARLMALFHSRDLDLVVLGPSLADPDVLPMFTAEIRGRTEIPFLLMASNSSEELAICALRAGINEYVKVSSPDELARAIPFYLSRTLAVRDHGRSLVIAPNTAGAFIGESAPMREIKARLNRVAVSDSSVLVTGETGTGKELVAEYLHHASLRRHKPFITINCAAIPDTLLESELFGYERGAFTGADEGHLGKLKAADGGTVFLDEIGDMSPYAQAKILRMVEAKEVQRLGRGSSILVNLRIIAATNHDLERLVRKGRFRKDLFFRLNVAEIRLPPLRDRRQDLPELIDHYVRHFNARFGRNVQRLSEEALNYFLGHDWPGNVRELKNLVEAIFVELPLADVSVAHLPAQFCTRSPDLEAEPLNERDRLLCALLATNWNKSKAAHKLEWSRMTLYRKMARYKITHRGAEDRSAGAA